MVAESGPGLAQVCRHWRASVNYGSLDIMWLNNYEDEIKNNTPYTGPPAFGHRPGAAKVWAPTAWTILEQDGPNHLDCDATCLRENQMALITPGCAPLSRWSCRPTSRADTPVLTAAIPMEKGTAAVRADVGELVCAGCTALDLSFACLGALPEPIRALRGLKKLWVRRCLWRCVSTAFAAHKDTASAL